MTISRSISIVCILAREMSVAEERLHFANTPHFGDRLTQLREVAAANREVADILLSRAAMAQDRAERLEYHSADCEGPLCDDWIHEL